MTIKKGRTFVLYPLNIGGNHLSWHQNSYKIRKSKTIENEKLSVFNSLLIIFICCLKQIKDTIRSLTWHLN